MFRVLKSKLYPNATQTRALAEYLDQGRYVYNMALAQRRDAWQQEGKSVTRFDQNKSLTAERAKDERLRHVPVAVARDAIRRVDLAFAGFFRRVKAKAGKAGYPRFKGRNRYNGFSIGQKCENIVTGGRIRVSGIDTPIRCRGLQPVEGTIKRLTVVRRADGWFARILVEDGLAVPALKPVESAIGIDLGLHAFIATSKGEIVECPKHYRKLEAKLRQANKRVARRKRGSNRRRKAVIQLQRIHAKIADCRSDFTHKLSRRLVDEHQLIVAEKLNVKGMVRSTLAKSVLDAGWSQFTSQLAYKAERAGCQFLQVNPHHTSQICSGCGQIVPKTLSERVHRCDCGLILDRDLNAAINVLTRGLSGSTPSSGGDEVMCAETNKPAPVRRTARSRKRIVRKKRDQD